MKKYLLCFILFFSFSSFYGQCPNSNIYLSSQEDVDNFKTRYPGCTEFSKLLSIYGSTITNLDGLDELTATTYVVDIWNTSLVNLSGLDNIIEMGTLKMRNNSYLENLSGIGQLTELDGNFTIQNNAKLTDLSDLINLQNVTFVLDIDNNDALTSLIGLENLNQVGGLVLQNGRLTDISSLNQLQQINYNLTVTNEYALQGLSGFNNLLSIGGNLVVKENRSLQSITGLNNFPSVRDIQIFNNEALTTISGLNQLETISGEFILGFYTVNDLSQNPVLNDVSGLQSLKTIAKDFSIAGNSVLPNLNGLQNLTSIGADLIIEKNDQITSLDGLDNLKTIGGKFLLHHNPSLLETDALLNLLSVGKDIGIWSNDSLQSLSGLNQLQTVGDSFEFGWNETSYLPSYQRGSTSSVKNLTQLSLSELTSVGGNFRIRYFAIPEINDISKLSHIGGELSLSHSEQLVEISGFMQLTSVSSMYLGTNSDLSTISGFNLLPSITEKIEITGNDNLETISGFSAMESVGTDFVLNYNTALHDATGFINLKEIDGDFLLDHIDAYYSKNENNSSFINFQSFSSLERIGKEFRLGPNSSLVNFEGLENLSSIGESFTVKTGLKQADPLSTISALTTLSGLSGLQSIGGSLDVQYNSALLQTSGLSSLISIGDDFKVNDNDSLTNFNSLPALTTIGRDLIISSNSSLTNLTGFESLTNIERNLEIKSNTILQNLSGVNNLNTVSSLNLYNNPELSDITALSNLSQVTSTLGGITISSNNSLVTLEGLEDVTNLHSLTIFYNSSLQSLEGLNSLQSLTNRLSIDRNPVLNDISALQNAIIDRDVNFGIKNNASLADCNIQSICNFTRYGNTNSFIYNNLPGCDSKYEIYLRCPNPDDLDGDGILNTVEVTDNTDPEDGCSYLESSQDLDLISVLWEEVDCDNDGILNGTELTNGSNPRSEDSDGDGVLDGDDSNPTDPCLPLQEKDYIGYDATNSIWQGYDCDLDGILNGDELTAGTNPYFNESFYTDSTYPTTFSEQQIETNGSARSIATNGTTVAVGRKWGSITKVEIYTKNENSIWVKTQEIYPSSNQGSDKFGWTIAMNENTLFIARPFGIENQPDTVFIYEKDNNGIWTEIQQIKASSDFMEDGFGSSMDVSENTLVVGADGIAPAGAVYVFEKNGNNTWVETTEIYPADELYEGAIGHAVAILDNQLVVGASGWGDKGAFIYEKQNNGSWLEVQQLGSPDGQNHAYAKDVAIAENRIIIGDVGYGDTIYDQGETFIYERSYNGIWNLTKTLKASDGFQEDYFGNALAINNNRIVVNLSADQTDVGFLYLYHKLDGAWVETHTLTDPEGFSWNFGSHVALAPGIIVTTSDEYVHFFEDSSPTGDDDGDGVKNQIDSHPNDPCLPVQLAGYSEYDADNTLWANADCDNDGMNNGDEFTNNTDPYQANSVEVDCTDSTLVGSDAQNSELFGSFLAFSKDGSTMAVSSYFDSAKGNYSGAVYIFKKQTDGSWVETQKLTASDGAERNYFGLSLAFSDNTLVIGSYGRNNSSGAVYIFDVNQNDIWSESQIITPSDLELYVHFGYAIAATKDYIIVGSPKDSQNGVQSGSAYIFKKELDGMWSEVQKIVSNDVAIRDNFGISVALFENTAVVGSYQDDDIGENSGSAYVFEKTSNTWSQVTKLNASNGLAGDYFAKNVSISNNTIVISSQNGGESGTAYIYYKSGPGVWQETSRLRSPSGSTDDFFADKILLQNNVLIIGAERDDENVIGGGSAYIYHKSATSWSLLKKVTLCNPDEYARFGNALALTGNTLALGSKSGTAVGSAHVYEIDIPDPEPLTITVENTEISCNASNEASLTILASGGTPSYLYIIENPALGNTSGNRTGQFSNLRAGDYIITVSDDLGVEVTQPISIVEPASLNLSTTAEKTCEDTANGSLSIEAYGGIPPYQFSIDNGATFGSNTIFENLQAANYSVVLKDSNGCTSSLIVTVETDENCSDFSLSSTNFTIVTTGESCASSDNGSVLITAVENHNYTAVLSDGFNPLDSKDFRTFTSFQDLSSGSYEICIRVEGQQEYEKCFTINITEPGELGVDSNLDESGKSISLNLQGGTKYYINLNGTEFSTSENHITIPLSKIENNITVKTDKECQGVYENTIMADYNSISIFPNPVEKGDVTIELPDGDSKQVLLTLFSQNGIRVKEILESPENRTVKINMDDLPPGIYTIIITTESQNSMRKIIKK